VARRPMLRSGADSKLLGLTEAAPCVLHSSSDAATCTKFSMCTHYRSPHYEQQIYIYISPRPANVLNRHAPKSTDLTENHLGNKKPLFKAVNQNCHGGRTRNCNRIATTVAEL
jgi:hypothetical protein